MTQEFLNEPLIAVEDNSENLEAEVFIFPLSFAQQRLWFLDQLVPDNHIYNLCVALQFQGKLDLIALEQTINEIVRRHETLRTTFAILEGQPVQVVAPDLKLTVPLIDLSPLSDRDSRLQQAVNTEIQQPFDLEQGPLFRVLLLRLAAEQHVFVVTIHHIVSDAWSLGILVQELTTLYAAFSTGNSSPLPELPIQFADFAVWQRQWLQDEVLDSKLKYWKQQLGGSLPVLQLPTDRPRPALQTFHGARQLLTIPSHVVEGLRALSRHENVTSFMTLLAAFNTLLYRYTGAEDIVVGSPVSDRNGPETEGLIGFFVNTVVLRSDLSGSPSFRELLLRVRELTLTAYAHQDLPFEKLVEVLEPSRDLSRNPLFQVMFAFQKAPLPSLDSEWSLSELEFEGNTSKFDLSLEIQELPESLECWFEYNTDLFDAATITRIAGDFATLLASIVSNPEQKIWELPLLNQVDTELLAQWNDTQADYPNSCIHELFEAQVEKTPDAVAIVFATEQLTYQELNSKANQLAHYLRSLGAETEVLVGICMERSLEMVIGLLAILKAGAAYVPLDPAYPSERLAFVMADAQVPVLLTRSHLINSLPPHQARLVCLDSDWERIALHSQENLENLATVDNLAYVIYTSGSTGKPKGVAIAHRSTAAFIAWAREVYSDEELAGVLASTSICFDLSVFELFVTLSWGGKVILAENALALPSLPAAQSVTLINTVPSAIAELLRSNGLPNSVRTVNLAGEPLQLKLVQQLYQRPAIARVFNLYGPSEDTTYSTFSLIKRGDGIVTIGRPISNTQIYLLDHHLQPVPVGIPGELYIGGAGLARGYLNRPELTAERFITNPFIREQGVGEWGSRGEKRDKEENSYSYQSPVTSQQSPVTSHQSPKLYKTGDLARYLPDGNIEYIGRIDNQVKIRGFRIELGEIESILTQHPDVREAVVIAREDIPGNKQLVAYIVSNFIPDRTPFKSECVAEIDGKTMQLYTEDISVGGVCITGITTPVQAGSSIHLRLLLPGGSEEQLLEGKIAWNRGQQAGVEFSLSFTQQSLLRQSVEHILATQGFLKVLQRTAIGNLRRLLQQQLPKYMMPDRFVLLSSLPLTPNGKVDRRALPEPECDRPELQTTFVAPRTALEAQLVNIWSQILGLAKVGIDDNFFELGGNSLKAAQFISYIRENLQVEVPVRWIFEKPTVEGIAKIIETVQQQGIAALDAAIDFQAEAVLPAEIRPSSQMIPDISNPQHIFLTGATGFLGAFLLDELLRQTQAQIYCLVRAQSDREGLQRLQKSLESYLLWNPSYSSRIIPVPGNLELPRLGLSEQQFSDLAARLDSIYHNGAEVNFVKPYKIVKAANVLGTQEVIRLACLGKVKPIHYVSTNGIFGPIGYFTGLKTITEDQDIDIASSYLHTYSGYAQAKWVSEKLLWTAKSRGIPILVFRPGFVSSHSQTGVTKTTDYISRFIKGCIQIGSFPELANFKPTIVPVDYVTKAIVHLSRQPESIGKAFHLTPLPEHNISSDEFFDLILSYGYQLRKVSYEQWQDELIAYTKDSKENPLYALIPAYREKVHEESLTLTELYQNTHEYDCQNTLMGLADTDITPPPIDAKLMGACLSYFNRINFLEPPVVVS